MGCEFVFKDNSKVNTVKELADQLKRKPWLYNNHVTTTRNDFAVWVRDCIDKTLAGKLFATTSYDGFMNVIEDYITKITKKVEEALVKEKPFYNKHMIKEFFIGFIFGFITAFLIARIVAIV